MSKVWTYRATPIRYDGERVTVSDFHDLPDHYKHRQDYADESEPHDEE
jgi:hypothetical protein